VAAEIDAHGFVDGAEDLLDLADLGLVLQIDGRVEVGHLLVGELRHRLPLARVQERRHLCATTQDRNPTTRSEKKIHPSKGLSTLAGAEVAPTDDLRGRALVAEPAAEPASAATAASTAEPAAAATPASAAAETAPAAAPSRWPHGACGALGLEESWGARGMRERRVSWRRGKGGRVLAAEGGDGTEGQGLLGF